LSAFTRVFDATAPQRIRDTCLLDRIDQHIDSQPLHSLWLAR
jgi:hypothetical protein